MIHIEKDQEVFEDKNLKVATATGDYEDSALIEFYDINTPEIISGSFQAQYIKYGSLVYRFGDPKELGNEILKIDPESTHVAASYVRMTNELLSQMNAGLLETSSLDQVITDEQMKTEEQMTNTEESVPEEIIEEPTEEEIPIEEVPVEEPTEKIIEEPVVEDITDLPVVEDETIVEPVSEEIIKQEMLPEIIPDTPEVIIPEVVPTEIISNEEPVSMINRRVKRKVG